MVRLPVRSPSSTLAITAPCRVLFIANTYPYWTGTDEAALALIRRLAASGHGVTVLETWSTILEPSLAGVNGVTIVRYPGKNMFFEQATHQWVGVLAAHRADVCILNKGWFAMQSVWLDLAARLSCRRYVALENHPADPPEAGSLTGWRAVYWRRRVAARLFLHYRLLHGVVAISTAVRDRLRRIYRLELRKSIVVPHGIDARRFRFDPSGRDRIRARLGMSDREFVFGSIGRLAHEKGFDWLLPVFSGILADTRHAHVRLIIAGDGEEAGALRRQVAQLGLQGSVTFLGWIDDADRVPFLSALDCFLMPSRIEGQGLALIQAMACERFCIATDSGGVADILTEPDIGELTPAADLDTFEHAMRCALATSSEQRSAVGRRARAHVMARFDLDRQTDCLIAALLGPFASQSPAASGTIA